MNIKIIILGILISFGILSLVNRQTREFNKPLSQKSVLNLDQKHEVERAKKSIVKTISILRKQEDFHRNKINQFFIEMKKYKNNAFSKPIRSMLMDEMIEKKEDIDIFFKVLTSEKYAESEFGENQSLARVYSIEVLKDLAYKGDDRQLVDTINILFKNIGESKKKINIGRRRDLEDLVQAYVEVNFRNLEGGLEELFRNIEVEESLIKEMFLGSFRALNKHFTTKKTDEILYKYFKKG